MSIVYTLVSTGTTIHCEHSLDASYTNYITLATRVLSKMVQHKETKEKISYTFDAQTIPGTASPSSSSEYEVDDTKHRYKFNLLNRGGLVILSLSTNDFPEQDVFSMLEDVRREFLNAFGNRWTTARAYELDLDFRSRLTSVMNQYNSDFASKRTRALKEVRSQIDGVRDVMSQNINMVLERGEMIDTLLTQSESLLETSVTFKTKSTVLKKKMWWAHKRIWFIGIIIFLLIVYGIVSLSCGGPLWPQCV